MKFIGDMKIGVRLGAGFAAVCLMLVASGVVTSISLGKLRAATEVITENRIPKIMKANDAQEQLNNVAVSIRNVLLSDTPEDRKAQWATVEKARAAVKGDITSLRKTVESAEGKAILAKIETTEVKYEKALAEYVGLAKDVHRDDEKQEAAGTVDVSIMMARQAAEEGRKRTALDSASYFLTHNLRPILAEYKSGIEALIKVQTKYTSEASAEAQKVYKAALTAAMGLAAFGVMLSLAIGFAITRSITRPISRAVEVANTVASGDLTSDIKVTSKDETGQLLLALKRMNENLVQTVDRVRQSSQTISDATDQVASGTTDLSARTEQQAGSLEETAASVEELTTTVKLNTENAQEASKLAVAASEVAVKGGKVVAEVVDTMSSINSSSRRIVDIISVIDSIAFQTNILALNAAVEAARAGEQGRGFAVVATEVRSLAQRSATAAKEIKSLIDASVSQVGKGAKLVDSAGKTMDEIVASITRVTDMMSEISGASLEQLTGIEQINQSIASMDNMTTQNAALVEEASAAASSMKDQTAALTEAVAAFKI